MKVFKYPGASTGSTKHGYLRVMYSFGVLLGAGKRRNIGIRRDANGGDFDCFD